jgi:hypothetical protein
MITTRDLVTGGTKSTFRPPSCELRMLGFMSKEH